MPRLIILTKDRSTRQVYISGRMTTIGRNPSNSLVVDRDRVSRKHAVIDWNGQQFAIMDVGSRNGTYVNGMRVMRRPLRNGDTITIGDCSLRFLNDVSTPEERALRLITIPGVLVDLQPAALAA
jgi:pSer/pThr/pTyr-binding forkhead associated (FHA) protein